MIKNLNIYDRSRALGLYIVENNATVRQTAQIFGISKSTVYNDVTENLNPESQLYKDVRKVLDLNKDERATRGGQATKQKYLSKRLSI